MANVEIMCKTTLKTTGIFSEKLCKTFPSRHIPVQNNHFPPSFPPFPTVFLTTPRSLKIYNIIHYSTAPTNTSTNNLKERKANEN